MRISFLYQHPPVFGCVLLCYSHIYVKPNPFSFYIFIYINVNLTCLAQILFLCVGEYDEIVTILATVSECKDLPVGLRQCLVVSI